VEEDNDTNKGQGRDEHHLRSAARREGGREGGGRGQTLLHELPVECVKYKLKRWHNATQGGREGREGKEQLKKRRKQKRREGGKEGGRWSRKGGREGGREGGRKRMKKKEKRRTRAMTTKRNISSGAEPAALYLLIRSTRTFL